MSVTNVYHKSRSMTYTQEYVANSSVLAWSFIATMDGVLKNVELENISSFKINGNTITHPYSTVFLNGDVYTVEITPVNPALASKISLITKKEIDKELIQSVPDFGQHNGRYTYAIIEGNKVVKYDNEYFKPANFSDFNTTIVSPKIQVITLPATDATIKCLKFVVIGGIPYILFLGTIYGQGAVAILMRQSDNAFFSLTGASNTWSTSYYDLRAESGFVASYDYVNNWVYYVSSSGIHAVTKIDLNTGSMVYFDSGSNIYNLFNYVLTKPGLAFNPYFTAFANRLNVIINERSVASIPSGVAGDTSPYFLRSLGYFCKASPQVNSFIFYDIYGTQIATTTVTNLNSRLVTGVNVANKYAVNLGGGTGQKMYGWLNLDTLTGGSATMVETTTGTIFSNGVASDYAEICIAAMSTERMSSDTELILIDPSLVTPHYGRYVESEGLIYGMVTNQFI